MYVITNLKSCQLFIINAQDRSFVPQIRKFLLNVRENVFILTYPIYTFIALSRLHRFIELLKEHKVYLSSKFVPQITTSKHFYDITAHKYVEEKAFDLSAKVIHDLSADMEDLTKKER